MRNIPTYLSRSRFHLEMSIVAVVGLTVGLAVLGSTTLAISQAIDAPAKNTSGATGMVVPSLIVMNAQGARLQGQILSLSGVAPSTIVFTDLQ